MEASSTTSRPCSAPQLLLRHLRVRGALASFERRGLKQRPPSTPPSTKSSGSTAPTGHRQGPARPGVARSRTFWALCHALAGGLPRDLVRSARLMFRLRRPRHGRRTGERWSAPICTTAPPAPLQAFPATAADELPDRVFRWVDDLYEIGREMPCSISTTGLPDAGGDRRLDLPPVAEAQGLDQARPRRSSTRSQDRCSSWRRRSTSSGTRAEGHRPAARRWRSMPARSPRRAWRSAMRTAPQGDSNLFREGWGLPNSAGW